MRIAIVGAGPAGLAALYTLEKNIVDNLEMICYERADQPGGEWIFTEKVGNDEFGLPVHGSMYRGMRANLPKELMTIHPVFPWPKQTIDFPYREEVLDYICNFAKQFSLTKYVKFRHFVRTISKVGENSTRLMVKVEDLTTRSTFTETFDYVLLASGKHGQPLIVHDTSKFNGLVLHYHDLKDPKLLANKRVLIIGSSFGGMDMVIHLVGITKELIVSYHHKPPFFGEQQGVTYKPKVESFHGSSVQFADGSRCEVDVLLYATGFVSVQPLSHELDLEWNTGKTNFFPLYKHVVHPTCPSIMFIGKAVSATILLSRIQAEFACAVISGVVKLPSTEEMLADIADFQRRWMEEFTNPSRPWKEFMPKVELEWENAVHLVKTTGSSPVPNYLKELYYSLIHVMASDLMNYQNYKILLTRKDDTEFEFYWKAPHSSKCDLQIPDV